MIAIESAFDIVPCVSPKLVAGLLLLCFVLWYLCRLVYNVYLHPLSIFPGPLLAGATRWYEGYFDNLVSPGGQYMYQIDRLHQEYGPVVRIAPDEVHIKDVQYYDTLYALGVRRNKVPYMVDIFGTTQSIFGTVQHDLHRSRRAALNPFFSKRSVTRLESMIKDKVGRLCDTLSIFNKRGQIIELRHALTATIVDITTEFSFGRCANALEEPDFAPEWDQMMRGVSEIVPLARQFPGIVQIAQALPISVVQLLNPLMAKFSQFERLVRVQITEIFARYRANTDEFSSSRPTTSENQPNSIFHSILNSSLSEDEKTITRMTQEALSVISAASETTSSVIATTIFHILTNPHISSRLVQELHNTSPANGNHPSQLLDWRQLECQPYLTAIVKEGLRISVPICGRLALVTPDQDLHYGKWVIPRGTYVSMSPGDALLHESIYPDPKVFRPERWLEGDAEHRKKMEGAFLPFNKGSRMCIGLNLAYANIYHILSALFRRFDLELVDTIRERDVDFVRDQFVSKPARESKGVKVRIVAEK